eukprot:2350671-Karenia_brevis.AAC.1
MRWGMLFIGVGVRCVSEPEQKSGIVGAMIERGGNYKSMYGIIAFQGMRWGINGLFWWGKRERLGL